MLAILLLWAIALAHVLRVIFQVEVIAAGHHLPMWLSGVAAMVLGFIAAMVWRESKRS
jgi:hypothetical protein